MIDCGIDESVQPRNSLLVVSAIIGQTAHMKKMAQSWGLDLANYGVDFFHAKDHWNRKYKPYHGLSMSKRKALLTDLVANVHRRADAGVSVCIDLEDYKKRTSERFRSQYGSAYSFAMQVALMIIHMHLSLRERAHEDMNLLIEDGHRNARQALDIIANGRAKDGALAIRNCGLAGKMGNPVLQAADLLAYSSCEFAASGKSSMFAKLAMTSRLPIITLPWNPSMIEAVTKDIRGRSKNLRDMVMW